MRNLLSFLFLSVLLVIIAFFLLNSKALAPIPNKQPLLSSSSTPIPTTVDKTSATVLADGLEVPWALAFLPDGRLMVTERVGRVSIIPEGGGRAILAATVPVSARKDGEGGLLGIVVHPEFAKNSFVYLYYTYTSTGNETLNKVIRMKLENDKLNNAETIVDAIPGAIYHNGGRIKFGPDGYLYITTGDARESSMAQSRTSKAGKIIRVTDSGKAVADNPFSNEVYTYGHRNPQGIAWDSRGQLWETEHGRSNPTGYDEVNLIEKGKNYGWEVIQGEQTKQGMVTPIINSGAMVTWAPSGAAFVGDSLFFAGLKSETLFEAVIEDNEVVELKEHLVNTYGRLREVVLGPDNMLYITTSNRDGRGNPKDGDDKVIRINPKAL